MPTEAEKQWMAAWRRAGPELDRIRRDELRALDCHAGLRLLGAGAGSKETTGLIAFQAWMMRLMVKQLSQSDD